MRYLAPKLLQKLCAFQPFKTKVKLSNAITKPKRHLKWSTICLIFFYPIIFLLRVLIKSVTCQSYLRVSTRF